MDTNEISSKRLTGTSLLIMIILPFLSGAAALSHELLWTRRLIDLLGATDWVTGRVLGFFFLGLSLGGYFATFLTRSKVPAVRWLMSAEFGIAALSLPAAFLPFWTDWIWHAIGTETLVSWQGEALKLLITMVVVIPPSVAMGFTLPLFIRTAANEGAAIGTVGIWIYMLNTLGGVFGLWITSTYLISLLGAQSTMLVNSSVNLLVAFSLLGFAIKGTAVEPEGRAARRRRQKEDNSKPSNHDQGNEGDSELTGKLADASAPAKGISKQGLLWLSLFSGFVVLSLEVLLFRLISLVVPSSYHTTSALLANVILLLALSSGIVSLLNSGKWTRHLAGNRQILIWAFAGAAVFMCLAPVFLFEYSDKLISIRYLEGLNGRTIDSIGAYWLLVFMLVAVSGGLALLASGLVFPALMTMSSDVDPSAKNIGLLLAVNGIGGLIGTELFNSLLIGLVGVYQGFVLLAAILAIVAFVMTAPLNRALAVCLAVSFACVFFTACNYYAELPYLSPRTSSSFEARNTYFGREGVWLIVEDPTDKSRSILVNNQYILGGSGVTDDQRRQLLIPWIIHPEARTVCSLGLATGISSSGLEILEDPPAVTSVELSASVEMLAKKYFREETDGFFDREDNRVVIEDARTFMAAADNQFDLIVGDLYRPHGTGEGRLFSVEHFENVRRALTDQGVFCQWLPVYQLNEDNWLTIAATFHSVFPEALVVYGNPDTRYPVVGLIARKDDSQWQADELESRFSSIPEYVLEEDPVLRAALALVVGTLSPDAMEGRTVNTLDNLEIEISAGNFWILKDLRKNRTRTFDGEFLLGEQLIEFNNRLVEQTESVLPPDYFRRFQDKIKAQFQRR